MNNQSDYTNVKILNNLVLYCAITHDGSGQLLNTNADTIASELQQSLYRKF
jgi:acetylglutamate kinase